MPIILHVLQLLRDVIAVAPKAPTLGHLLLAMIPIMLVLLDMLQLQLGPQRLVATILRVVDAMQ